MNAVQITTIIVLIIFVINLTAVSVYLILLIRDLRNTTQNANKIVEDVSHVTGSVGGPLAAVAGFLTNIARSTKAFKSISSIFEKNEEEY